MNRTELRAQHSGFLRFDSGASPGQVKDSTTIIELLDELREADAQVTRWIRERNNREIDRAIADGCLSIAKGALQHVIELVRDVQTPGNVTAIKVNNTAVDALVRIEECTPESSASEGEK